jgi:CoA:oxalate CoA-transferase
MAAHPEYLTNDLRLKNLSRLQQEIEGVLKGKTTTEWIGILAKAGVPSGPINNIAQAVEHPQVAARNMLVEVPDGSGGSLRLAGNPLKMSAFDDPAIRDAAPDLDADREAILSFISGSAAPNPDTSGPQS